jgi:MscS family membrane protein
MDNFLDQVFLDNPVRDYLVLAAVLLFVFVIKRFLSKIIATLIFRVVKHWSPQIDQRDFVNLLLRPLEYFLVLVAFMFSINRFTFPQKLNINLYNSFTLQNATDTILQMVFSMSIIWIMLRLIDFIAMVLKQKTMASNDKSDTQFIIFFKDFFKAIVFIFGAIIFIRILFGNGLVEKIVAGLGIGAAALALAAKESIENLIGSFIIFSDKPFRVGDTVKVDAFQGVVEKIGLRSTRLRTPEKTFVTVPNKKMVDSILDNFSLRTQQRVVIKLELAGNTPANKIMQLLQDIKGSLESNSNVLPGFTVNLNDFTKDTYVIQIAYMTYIIDGNQYAALREDINLQVIKSMETHDIKLSKANDAPAA